MSDALEQVEEAIIASLSPFLAEKLAVDIVRAAVDKVRAEWGGDKPYIAKVSTRALRERNRQIIRDWCKQRDNGREDRSVLAAKYDVHQTTIDRVIRKHLAHRCPSHADAFDF